MINILFQCHRYRRLEGSLHEAVRIVERNRQ